MTSSVDKNKSNVPGIKIKIFVLGRKSMKSYFTLYITSILFVLQLFRILKFPSEASA